MQNSSEWMNSHVFISKAEAHNSAKASDSLITITSICLAFLKGKKKPHRTHSQSLEGNWTLY